MVRKIYQPPFPDEPGDDVTFIPGTDNRYGMTENGNTYFMNGQDVLEVGQVPLKPEWPTHRREYFRLRIRLNDDPPKPERPSHTVAYLMIRTFRPGDLPDYETGAWRIKHKNNNNRDCRLSNLEIVEGTPRKRRNRLTFTEEEMALHLLRRAPKEGWQFTDIARFLHVQVDVLERLALCREIEQEHGRKASLRYRSPK